jgi:predicted GH43/DUF377 family glycosyl hydrolase
LALSGDGRIALSASDDKTLTVWDVGSGRELRILSGHSGDAKSVAMSLDGQTAVSASSEYFLGTTPDKNDQMGLAYSTDLVHWTEATKTPVLPRRPGQFDSRVVEPGPSPILTPDGIVLIYNGGDDKLVYRTAIAILDRNDPRKLLYRSEQPIFAPEKEWEKVGQVPNVVFVEGVVRRGERYLFYYGGADKYVGVAEAPVVSH